MLGVLGQAPRYQHPASQRRVGLAAEVLVQSAAAGVVAAGLACVVDTDVIEHTGAGRAADGNLRIGVPHLCTGLVDVGVSLAAGHDAETGIVGVDIVEIVDSAEEDAVLFVRGPEVGGHGTAVAVEMHGSFFADAVGDVTEVELSETDV